MLQVITIKLDLDKVVEFGTLIIRVIPPREDLPNGTVLLYDPLSLPGFKFKVTENAPTISIQSGVIDEFMPCPKPAPVPEQAAPVDPTNVTKGFFGNNKNKNKKK